MSSTKIGIIGAGAWGTVIAQLFASNGHDVNLWCYKSSIADQINKKHAHHRLPDIQLSNNIHATDHMDDCYDSSIVILGLSSEQLVAYDSIINWSKITCPLGFLSKGIIEPEWFLSTWLEKRTPQPVFAISGPNLALEIANKKPAATVVASVQQNIAKRIQQLLSNDYFRCYTSTDIIGVQCGGIFKNVFAIAAGCIDGLDLGNNAKSALITRGIVELKQICEFFGGNPDTILGLSGVGDLMTTCSSTQSRNWQLGYQMGKENSSQFFEDKKRGITEGVRTIQLMYDMLLKNDLNLPIMISVGKMFKEAIMPSQIIKELMKRGLKSELGH